jgi:hypothetical protein
MVYSVKIYMRHTGKAIPSQALRDREGSRRMRLPEFKTTGK